MKLGIIGCGNMGKAFALSLGKDHKLSFYDRNLAKRDTLEQEGLGKSYPDIKEAIQGVDYIILAVKPSQVDQVAQELSSAVSDKQTIISMLAGTLIENIQKLFPKNNIVRIMPNLAVVCGEGMIGICEEGVSEEEKNTLSTLFSKLGKIYWLQESKMDALAALAGSGPAFVFGIIEAMVEAGITMGFNSKQSLELCMQMIRGSLSLLESTGKHPAELKWQITSPAGTTIAGLKKFEECAVRAGILNTFLATFERTKELH